MLCIYLAINQQNFSKPFMRIRCLFFFSNSADGRLICNKLSRRRRGGGGLPYRAGFGLVGGVWCRVIFHDYTVGDVHLQLINTSTRKPRFPVSGGGGRDGMRIVLSINHSINHSRYFLVSSRFVCFIESSVYLSTYLPTYLSLS